MNGLMNHSLFKKMMHIFKSRLMNLFNTPLHTKCCDVFPFFVIVSNLFFFFLTQCGSIWLWALRWLWLWFIWGAHVGVSGRAHPTSHQVVQTPEGKRQGVQECKTWVGKLNTPEFTMSLHTKAEVIWNISSLLPVKRYVRKGIPNEHRALIWMAASGAQDQLDKNPGYYQSLLIAHHDPKLVETICTGQVFSLLQLWHTTNQPQSLTSAGEFHLNSVWICLLNRKIIVSI